MNIDWGGLVGIIIWTVALGGLVGFWVAALVSISRRSSQMTGVELIGWCAFVVFAQLFGPLIWFFIGRDRYPAPPSTS